MFPGLASIGQPLMANYRAGTELALAQADFVNTLEMSILQALTIYLIISPVQYLPACSEMVAD